MSPRVYVLLDIVTGKASRAVRTLRRQPGVLMADEIESGSRVVMVMEASDRQKLAELTTQALSLIDSVTESVQLLPAKNGRVATAPVHTDRDF